MLKSGCGALAVKGLREFAEIVSRVRAIWRHGVKVGHGKSWVIYATFSAKFLPVFVKRSLTVLATARAAPNCATTCDKIGCFCDVLPPFVDAAGVRHTDRSIYVCFLCSAPSVPF